MPQLNVTLVPAPDQVVVRVTGDADLHTRPLLADALHQAGGLGTRQVVVDVAGARFWDCSGLHVLAAFTTDLGGAGRSCRIVGAPARTRGLISAAGLGDRLNLDGALPPRALPSAAPRAVERPAAPRAVERPVERQGAEDRTAMPARRSASGHPWPVRSRRMPTLAVRRRG